MPDDRKMRAATAFLLAVALGIAGAVGVGVALWFAFGWPAAVAFWGVLALLTAWLILQTEA